MCIRDSIITPNLFIAFNSCVVVSISLSVFEIDAVVASDAAPTVPIPFCEQSYRNAYAILRAVLQLVL